MKLRISPYVQRLLQHRSAFCLAAVLLCCWGSEAEGQDAPGAASWLFRSSVGSAGGSVAATPRFEVPGGESGERGRASWLQASAADLVALFGRSDVQSYDEQPGGGLRLKHETAAAQFEVPVMRQSRLKFFADLGFGATRLRSHDPGQFPDGRGGRLNETYISGMGGLTVQYQLTNDLRAFVGARYFQYFNDVDDLRLAETPDAGRLLKASAWTFPLTFGVQLSFD